jgi:hypothetical protein
MMMPGIRWLVMVVAEIGNPRAATCNIKLAPARRFSLAAERRRGFAAESLESACSWWIAARRLACSRAAEFYTHERVPRERVLMADDPDESTPQSGYESPSTRRPASAEGTLAAEAAKERRDPYAAFRFPYFTFYSVGNLISVIGRLMLLIAVEWEIYERTNSATALGLVGLAIALPVVFLSLPAGYVADRYNRRTIVLVTQALSAICSVALAFISFHHLDLPAWPILQSGNALLGKIAACSNGTRRTGSTTCRCR